MKSFKMNSSLRVKCFIAYIILILIFTSGCVPYAKLRYFNDIDKLSEPVVNPMKSKTINPFDKLSVTVLSTDVQSANLLNSNIQGSTVVAKGYVVDETGYINFPFVGKIQVGGLTLLETGDKIKDAMSGIITKPEVIVNLIDSKVTIIGEVGSQGRFLINEDFINIYDALALAGGLTMYSDRGKIILLRDENNKLIHYKLNLNDSKIASSPLFYIIPNDIIIVEPLRQKSLSSSTLTTVVSTITSLISVFTLMITLKII